MQNAKVKDNAYLYVHTSLRFSLCKPYQIRLVLLHHICVTKKYKNTWNIAVLALFFYGSYLAFTLNHTTWGLIVYILRKYELQEIKQMSVWNISLLVLCCPIKSLMQGANFNSRTGVYIIIHTGRVSCVIHFLHRVVQCLSWAIKF